MKLNKKDRLDITCEECGKIKKYLFDAINIPVYESECIHNKIEVKESWFKKLLNKLTK